METIIGNWILQDGKIIGDENCLKINAILDSGLVRIGTRDGGWVTLFKNSNENIYWELFYQKPDGHGGGPPSLAKLNEEQVRILYGESIQD